MDLDIKQFVVTNCSKERPGPIVTETLKNGILILIIASKELLFYANSKYMFIFCFSPILAFPIKSYEPEEICFMLEKLGKTSTKSPSILTKIPPSDSAYQKTLF